MFREEIPYTIEDIDRLSAEEKRANWDIAFGLQAVDGLVPSEYMKTLAEEHVVGKKTYKQIADEVMKYYADNERNRGENEADIVSLRIKKALAENAFAFSPATLKGIHRELFKGVIAPEIPVGEYRNYNITKSERVLSGKSVVYSPANLIKDVLAYDFGEEKRFDYSVISQEEKAHHIMRFISGVWQVHLFGEGNTRTCAVFAIKYLRSFGFSVDNETFRAHSEYFRDALALDNYREKRNPEYLKMFTENLLFSGGHDLSAGIPAVC